MKVKSRRCLCALLAVVMLFCTAPICGSAVEESTPITEVVALREENVKHFDLGNGQYHAVSYSYPVHELDSEGNWVDINTALTTGNARSLGQYATEDGRVTVSQIFRPNSQILGLQEDGKGISMSMVADSSNVSTFSMSRAAVENAPVRSELSEYATIEEATSGDYGSRVYYEDVLPNTDLEYIVDIDMVKENIIVKAAQESYSYTFALDLTGLSAQLEDEGSVSLIDTATQERKYMIPAPYMYDAQGNASFDAAYTLTQDGNTCYLTVTADADWINAQGHQFPVTIDPSVVSIAEPAADTYIDSETPNTNYGDSRPLWARSTRATYIKCANISLPEGATLNYASLAVFYGYLQHVTSGYVNVEAYRVDSPWDEQTLTWNIAAQDSDLLMDLSQMHYENDLYAGQGATLSSPDQVDFFITPVVRAWLYQGYTNYGIALKYGGGTNLSVVFKSSETESIYRPRINYQYSTPKQYIYTHYHDSTISNTRAGQISDAVAAANTAYLRQFNVSFSTVGNPTYNGSFTDICNEGSNAPCSFDCSPHHKNVIHISDLLYAEARATNEIKVLWTDHNRLTYCNHETGICQQLDEIDGTTIALVVDSRPVIHFTNLLPDGGSNEEYRACMAINLIHETAHTFGLCDRYNIASHQEAGWQCVMEGYAYNKGGDTAVAFYNGIVGGTRNAFCAKCQSDLAKLLP